MAVSVQSLFSSTADIYRLKWIAGKEGAAHLVRWMYYTEDVSTLSFLRGGELVITTGMEIGRKADNTGESPDSFTADYLSALIKAIFAQNVSALILNTGKYITSVPEEIIRLCDRLQLPLLTMPWEIHIIDIMQDYGNRIVSDRQKAQNLEKCLFNSMFNPQEFDGIQLAATAFAGAKEFSVMLLELPEELAKMDGEEFRRYMDYSFNIKTGIRPGDYAYFLHENKIIYVFHDDAHIHLPQIEKAIKRNKTFEGMRLSVSGVCKSAIDLCSEYRHAELAMKLCGGEHLVGDYEKLGIFKLLGEVQDRRVLENLYDSVLGPLEQFGKDKLDDYLNTLRLYLGAGGRVQKTAEKNFTHRNTVNYRIKKICDILGIDLSDGETRYMIQTALYIRDMLDKL
ncbi:MAG: PucR family transcriptional regulator ligand-binding domain-containing protein [Treponema sp.]|nr:PucR family transcriptional regulator ligand-binding domain-containing protein [Treponema sp.]